MRKKKKKRKIGHEKVIGAGLEGFVDLMDPTVSESTEDKEVEMSSLAAGIAMWMRKSDASA